MTIILTCSVCTTQREPQAHESMVNVGGETQAFCAKCGEVQKHAIGIPARKPVELEFKRRKP